jgi:ubiquinone/menaquinone biosynthesis C-methylase UbiE
MSAATSTENDWIRERYEKDAPRYDATMAFFERVLFRDAREWVCSKAEGRTLEIAVGSGRNLPHYPPDVELTGIELAPAMLRLAEQRAAEVRREADLRLGDATALEFADGSFDSVVCTFSLCTIPDDAAAVAEVRRVLRPGGRFLLAEHVRSTRPRIHGGQKLIDPLTVRFQGDHMVREPLRHLHAERFEIEQLERYGLGIVERVVARRPTVSG